MVALIRASGEGMTSTELMLKLWQIPGGKRDPQPAA